jgi:hypothetical protein
LNDQLLHDRRGRHHLVHWHSRHPRPTEPRRWRRHESRRRSTVHTHRRRLHSHGRRHTHSRWHHTLRRAKSWRRWRGSSQSTSKLSLIRSLVRHGRSSHAKSSRWSCRWPCTDGQRVVLPRLRGEQSLRIGSVSFPLSILFERVLDRNRFVHEELTVHRFDRRVRRLEICV